MPVDCPNPEQGPATDVRCRDGQSAPCATCGWFALSNRRGRANRLFRHVSNHAAAAEGFTPGFAAFLRRSTPAGSVMQLFFRHPEIFSGKEN
jgi:hypothetical protein